MTNVDVTETDVEIIRPTRRRRRSNPVLLIKAKADLPERYQEVFALDDIDVLSQAVALASLFNGAIRQDNGRFDPALARELIAKYNQEVEKPSHRLGIFGITQQTITQSNDVVSAMVEKVLEAIKNALGVALGTVTVAQLTASVSDAFTDLQEEEGDAWIFWQKKTGNKTSYSYSILFSLQDASTGKFIVALPMSLEITADLAYEKVLWITLQDRASYSVKVDAMKVGQLIFPSEQAYNATRTMLTQARKAAIGADDINFENISNIRITNWARTVTYATAANGVVGYSPGLTQLTVANPLIFSALTEEQVYLVTFDQHDVTKTLSLIFNAVMPGNEYWFVSA